MSWQKDFFRRYILGAQLHWKQVFGWALAAWGLCWLIVNSLTFLLPRLKEQIEANNTITLGAFVLVALGVVAYRLPIRTRIAIRFPTTNTTVEILFADLFECGGHWAISVNEYFDGRLGEYVSPNSVHGQFIQRYCEGDSNRFESKVDALLSSIKSKQKARKISRASCYPIGTTAVMDLGDRKCFLFALTTTDAQTAKSFADVVMMWTALDKLWREVRAQSNGHPVNLPLIGSGRAAVGLEPMHLLRLMLVSLLVATREREITRSVRIVLHDSLIDRVDLSRIRAEWQ